MPSPFVGGSYNLDSRPASVQRTVNMMPVPIEPGNEREGWVFKDVPGLVAVDIVPPHVCTTGPGWSQTVKTSHRHTGLSFLNGKFVSPYLATGSAPGGVSYSVNGTTWTDGGAFTDLTNSGHINVIAYGNGLYVAYGNLTNAAWQSPDAITWTLGGSVPNVTKSTELGMWFGNGLFVICAGITAQVFSSANASNHATHTTPVTFNTGLWNEANNLHYGCASASGAIYTSPDLTTWTLKGTTSFNSTTSTKRLVTDGAGHMVAIDGTTQRNYVSHSADNGATWANSTGLPVLAVFYVDILYLESQGFYLLTDNHGRVYISFDHGASWTATVSDLNGFLGDNNNWWMASNPEGTLYAAVPVTGAAGTVAAVGTC